MCVNCAPPSNVVKRHQKDLLRKGVGREKTLDLANCDGRGQLGGEAVYSAADGGKGDRLEAVIAGLFE